MASKDFVGKAMTEQQACMRYQQKVFCKRCMCCIDGSSERFVADIANGSSRMAKKVVKRQPWTKEDIRTLKTLAREKKKTTTIARMLKRTVGATYQQASKLGVALGSRG